MSEIGKIESLDNAPPDPAALFRQSWSAADKAETLQRLDGLTKAVPVAAIQAREEHAALASVRKLIEERDQAVAGWRASEREVEMLRAQLAAEQRRC